MWRYLAHLFQGSFAVGALLLNFLRQLLFRQCLLRYPGVVNIYMYGDVDKTKVRIDQQLFFRIQNVIPAMPSHNTDVLEKQISSNNRKRTQMNGSMQIIIQFDN